MGYRWHVDVQDLFGERHRQMVSGLPATDVDAVRAAVTDMWADEPGGWVHEWSRLAAGYAENDKHRLAAQAYGWAKFPALADDARRTALARQLEQYTRAAPGFEVDFERRKIAVPYRDGTTEVPVHLLTPPGRSGAVLLASGGVDTWKMDLHTLFENLALRTGMRVLAFDIPGTGESTVPLTANDGAQVVRGLVAEARRTGDGHVVHLGVSMGGYFSARSGLAGEVDAAIVLGGPVELAFDAGRPYVHGMRGIIGNAMGFDHEPSDADLAAVWPSFDLRPLLDRDDNAPMLVVNGADDVHVPQHDTLVFQGRRDTEVHLIPGAGHCATPRLSEAVRIMLAWLALD